MKKPPIRIRILIVGLVVATGLAIYFVPRLLDNRDNGMLASGTVEATEAQLGFQAAGRIESIGVQEGDKVKQGQVLAQLDTRETEARLAQARALIAATELRLHDAQRDLGRSRELLAGGAIGQEAYDKAQLAYRVAQSDNAQARASAQAIEAVLANMIIHAGFDGVVTVRHREPGEIVAPGVPVLTVMNPDDRWVRIYIPEYRIGAVHRGQKAAIQTDTWRDKRYGGEVTYIASEAEFTPKNVQTTEERVKLVYAVKVRVTDDPGFELKPGMPADVTLEIAAP
jgi:HlyD family secretion protein